MKVIQLLLVMVMVVLTAACLKKEEYNLQGKAGDIGDAMEHCRAFINYLLPDEAFVYIDTASSREEVEFFDIFLDLHDSKQEGFAQCRVNKRGLITYHSIREFRQKGRSFSGE